MIKKIFHFKFSIFNSVKQAGFTVLESIIAIFVLSLSISGAFSAVRQSLNQSILSKEEVKAFYLAQEAVEIIRNKRDNNHLEKIVNSSSNSWLYGIAENGDPIVNICDFGDVCRVDSIPIPPSLTSCGDEWGDCATLNQNPTTFLYSYGLYPPSKFKREITFESINADEVAVIVRITWTKGMTTKEFKIKTHLFNRI